MSAKDIDKQIEILEKELAQNTGANEELVKQINRLKFLAFEEDIREQNDTSLLLKG